LAEWKRVLPCGGSTRFIFHQIKQTEKLDLILRVLYNLRAEKDDIYLHEICESQNIPLASRDELYEIAERLKNDGYIKFTSIQAGIYAKLTSKGIEYCEEDSYAYKGSSIITNTYHFNITNSPNSNIVSASSNTSIHINNHGEINNKIRELKARISNSKDINNNQKSDILECIEEVEASVNADRKPKFALKQLFEQASNVAGVGSLLLDLGQLILGHQS
jgi:hypothetical protein